MNTLTLWFHKMGSPPTFYRVASRLEPWLFAGALLSAAVLTIGCTKKESAPTPTPDKPTPQHIIDAAKKALAAAGKTGADVFRRTIARKLGDLAVSALYAGDVSAILERGIADIARLAPIVDLQSRKAMREIWPAILVTGASFAASQFFVSNYIGPELVDVIAAVVSMISLVSFLKVWQPKTIWTSVSLKGHEKDGGEGHVAPPPVVHPRADVIRAWTPWAILTVFVFIWGLPPVKAWFNGIFAPSFPISGLHNLIEKMPPVVKAPHKEAAVYTLNLLSATGTGILLSAIVGGLVMKYNPLQLVTQFFRTLWLVRYSLLTIVLMLALGTLTRYSGTDTTLGLAFANTGVFYPFFGTLMGWLGVALTGSDTASNVLFGGMQKVAAEQLGLSPNLMGAANSSGGVMGKMIDAQSIVVASTATRWFDHEGDILRYVFFHSVALAVLVGGLVTLMAYVYPFTKLVY
mgnify:CR=1 FL=1